jgi:carbamoylphosphate synthase large subunit
MVRAAYALGGLGSGICDDEAQVTESTSLEAVHNEHLHSRTVAQPLIG